MKKAINYSLFAALFLSIGCAIGNGLLRFQDRELLVHPDKPGLAYPHNYQECVDRRGVLRVFGKKKCKTKHKIDFYDFTDKPTRMKIINAGFTCKSKMRFKY